jgi:crossover junction endodeoxyribonuclease RuvC
MTNEITFERYEYVFAGIDPSLKGTGIVLINENGSIIKQLVYKTDKECYMNNEQWILDVYEQVKFITNVPRLKSVYIEGLAYSSLSTTLHERIGLLFLIKTLLFKKDIKYKEIPPTSLKKWTTTDGHAEKWLMMAVAKCRWGIEFNDDNICDAFCLAQLAREGNGK